MVIKRGFWKGKKNKQKKSQRNKKVVASKAMFKLKICRRTKSWKNLKFQNFCHQMPQSLTGDLKNNRIFQHIHSVHYHKICFVII
jgi:hypothetical protein